MKSDAKEGRPRVYGRTTINAILYVLTTGCSWMDLPSKYGADVPAWRSLRTGGSKVYVGSSLLSLTLIQSAFGLKTRSGACDINSNDEPKVSPSNPVTRDEIKEKFRRWQSCARW